MMPFLLLGIALRDASEKCFRLAAMFNR